MGEIYRRFPLPKKANFSLLSFPFSPSPLSQEPARAFVESKKGENKETKKEMRLLGGLWRIFWFFTAFCWDLKPPPGEGERAGEQRGCCKTSSHGHLSSEPKSFQSRVSLETTDQAGSFQILNCCKGPTHELEGKENGWGLCSYWRVVLPYVLLTARCNLASKLKGATAGWVGPLLGGVAPMEGYWFPCQSLEESLEKLLWGVGKYFLFISYFYFYYYFFCPPPFFLFYFV